MNTNTKKYHNNIKQYLLESVDGLDPDIEINTFDDAMVYIWGRFKKDFCHEYNMKRYPNEQKRLENWLAGLPINIDHYYCDIVKAYKRLHETDELDDKTAERVMNNWFSHIAFFLLKFKPKESKV